MLVAEPYVSELPAELEGAEHADFEDAIRRADIVVVLTGHSAFRSVRISDLDGKALIDTCGLFRAKTT